MSKLTIVGQCARSAYRRVLTSQRYLPIIRQLSTESDINIKINIPRCLKFDENIEEDRLAMHYLLDKAFQDDEPEIIETLQIVSHTGDELLYHNERNGELVHYCTAHPGGFDEADLAALSEPTFDDKAKARIQITPDSSASACAEAKEHEEVEDDIETAFRALGKGDTISEGAEVKDNFSKNTSDEVEKNIDTSGELLLDLTKNTFDEIIDALDEVDSFYRKLGTVKFDDNAQSLPFNNNPNLVALSPSVTNEPQSTNAAFNNNIQDNQLQCVHTSEPAAQLGRLEMQATEIVKYKAFPTIEVPSTTSSEESQTAAKENEPETQMQSKCTPFEASNGQQMIEAVLDDDYSRALMRCALINALSTLDSGDGGIKAKITFANKKNTEDF